MRESAMSDLAEETRRKEARHQSGSCQLRFGGDAYRCPPLSSVRLCFHTVPSRTLTSRPCMRSWPSGGCNLAKFPGNSSAKMPPKSLWSRAISRAAWRGTVKPTHRPSPRSSGAHPVYTGQALQLSSRSFPCPSSRSLTSFSDRLPSSLR
jgi:hypothetical protein